MERIRQVCASLSFLIFLPCFSLLAQQAPVNVDDVIKRIAEGKTPEVKQELSKLRPTLANTPALYYIEGLVSTEGTRSITMFRVVTDSFPNSEWADDALVRIYEIYRGNGQDHFANEELRRLERNYPDSPYLTTQYIKESDSRLTDSSNPGNAAKAGSEYAVQVGAFAQKGNALKLQRRLRSDGYRVDVYDNLLDGKNLLYLVWVGSFKTEQEAEKLLPRLKSKHQIHGVVRVRNTWKKW